MDVDGLLVDGRRSARERNPSEKVKAAVANVKAGGHVDAQAIPKKRGRSVMTSGHIDEAQAIPKKRGRPLGSKNKPKDTSAVKTSRRIPVCVPL